MQAVRRLVVGLEHSGADRDTDTAGRLRKGGSGKGGILLLFASRLFPAMPSVATVPVQDETATGPPIATIPHGDDRGGEGPARSRVRLSDLFTVRVSQPPEWGFHDAIGHALDSKCGR
jgi:hypothetical protein